MNSYNYIINPCNSNKIYLNSTQGTQILAKYTLKSGLIQSGGVTPLLAIAGIDISLKAIVGVTGFLVCIGGGVCYLMSDKKTEAIKEKHKVNNDEDLTPELQEKILKDLLKNQEAVDKLLNASLSQSSYNSDIEKELDDIEKELDDIKNENMVKEQQNIDKMSSSEKQQYLSQKQEEGDLEKELEELLKQASDSSNSMNGGVDPLSISLSTWLLCTGGIGLGSYVCYKLGLFSSNNDNQKEEEISEIDKIENAIHKGSNAIVKFKETFVNLINNIKKNNEKLKVQKARGLNDKHPLIKHIKKNIKMYTQQKKNIKVQILTLNKSVKTLQHILTKIKNGEKLSISLSSLETSSKDE
jgi:hypothetical protein